MLLTFVCACVSVNKISHILSFSHILNLASFLVEAFPLTQGGNHSILKKKCPGVRAGVGVPKFVPNDNRKEKNSPAAVTPKL